MSNMNFCQWLYYNLGPIELKATALPTEPPPLPGETQVYLLLQLSGPNKALI